MSPRADLELEVAAIKGAVPLVDLVGAYVGLKKRGREFVGLSPFSGEKTPSFTVVPAKGFWHCFSSGRNGDHFDFLMQVEGVSFAEAKLRLAGWAGHDTDAARETAANLHEAARRRADAEDARVRKWKYDFALALWRAAEPVTRGSLVEVYLSRARGIDLDALEKIHGWRVPPTIRFVAGHKHPALNEERPCMVGYLQRPDRMFAGIHRTWLRGDGLDKVGCAASKMTLGAIWGSAGRMAPVDEHLIIGEGYETTLSVMAHFARQGKKAAGWMAVSLGNLAGAGQRDDASQPHPSKPGVTLPSRKPDLKNPGLILPREVRRVTLLQDLDGDRPNGAALIARACAKFRAADIDVAVASPPEGMDFNDWSRALA